MDFAGSSNNPIEQDERAMRLALREAEFALEAGDVPVGAIIVHEGRVIGRGHNQRELMQDPTAHAEMIALTAAASALGTWRLNGCTMYVTLEPCSMCAGALVLARLDALVFGAIDPKAGACGSIFDLVSDPRLNHRVPIRSGVLGDECGQLLRAFFAQKRAAKETK